MLCFWADMVRDYEYSTLLDHSISILLPALYNTYINIFTDNNNKYYINNLIIVKDKSLHSRLIVENELAAEHKTVYSD